MISEERLNKEIGTCINALANTTHRIKGLLAETRMVEYAAPSPLITVSFPPLPP